MSVLTKIEGIKGLEDVEEARLLANFAYQNGTVLPDGYSEFMPRTHTWAGLEAVYLINENKEATYLVYAGTNSLLDATLGWAGKGKIPYLSGGFHGEEFLERTRAKGYNPITIGHSQGGFHALEARLDLGIDAVVINSSDIWGATKYQYQSRNNFYQQFQQMYADEQNLSKKAPRLVVIEDGGDPLSYVLGTVGGADQYIYQLSREGSFALSLESGGIPAWLSPYSLDAHSLDVSTGIYTSERPTLEMYNNYPDLRHENAHNWSSLKNTSADIIELDLGSQSTNISIPYTSNGGESKSLELTNIETDKYKRVEETRTLAEKFTYDDAVDTLNKLGPSETYQTALAASATSEALQRPLILVDKYIDPMNGDIIYTDIEGNEVFDLENITVRYIFWTTGPIKE